MSTTNASSALRWLPDDAGWKRFEIASRGDHVGVRLHLPSGPARPLIWVLGDTASEVVPIPGFATAALDLPLLGDRSSPKWSERLGRCLREGPGGAADRALLEEFETQSTADLAAAARVCRERPEVDPARAGLLGSGAGAWIAARQAGTEPGFTAVALCGQGLAPGWEADAGAGGTPPCFIVTDFAEGVRALGKALGG